MTVAELLAKISAAFPAFNARAVEALAPVFRARFEKHEGPALRDAWMAVAAEFVPGKNGLHPLPKHFEPFLPSNHPKITGDGPKLDFKARGERVRSLLADWRQAQGIRAAGNNKAIMRALEFMVEPLANLWAWSANPRPIRLTRAQVRIVQQRAISQERVRLHGPLPRDGKLWWSQIEGVCEAWGIPAVYEEWAAKKQERAPIPPQQGEAA